jgi:hypothetical protein
LLYYIADLLNLLYQRIKNRSGLIQQGKDGDKVKGGVQVGSSNFRRSYARV